MPGASRIGCRRVINGGRGPFRLTGGDRAGIRPGHGAVDEDCRGIAERESRRPVAVLQNQLERHGDRNASSIGPGQAPPAGPADGGIDGGEDASAVSGVRESLKGSIEDETHLGAAALESTPEEIVGGRHARPGSVTIARRVGTAMHRFLAGNPADGDTDYVRPSSLDDPFLRATVTNFFFCLSLNAFVLLPLYVQRLGGTAIEIGIVMGLYGAVGILCQPLLGPWVDAVGRRPFMVLGPALAIVAALLASVAGSIGLLGLVRTLQGLAFSAFFVASFSYVIDLVPPARRGWALGIYGVAGMMATAIAPWAGSGSAAV